MDYMVALGMMSNELKQIAADNHIFIASSTQFSILFFIDLCRNFDINCFRVHIIKNSKTRNILIDKTFIEII